MNKGRSPGPAVLSIQAVAKQKRNICGFGIKHGQETEKNIASLNAEMVWRESCVCEMLRFTLRISMS